MSSISERLITLRLDGGSYTKIKCISEAYLSVVLKAVAFLISTFPGRYLLNFISLVHKNLILIFNLTKSVAINFNFIYLKYLSPALFKTANKIPKAAMTQTCVQQQGETNTQLKLKENHLLSIKCPLEQS